MVADASNDGSRRTQSFHAPFCGAQIKLTQNGTDHELKKWRPRVHQLHNGAFSLSHAEFTGVHAIGFNRDEGLGCEVLVHFECAKGGFLSCRVTIEGEDHFSTVGFPIAEDNSSGTVRTVSQKPADNFYVVFTKSGTATCDRISHTGCVGSHDVRVAFDDNDLTVSCNFFLRKIEAIEDLRLVIDRGFRGVEVLWRFLVLVVQTPGAKADRRTRNVTDWPHEPAAETIVEATVSAACKACNLDFLIGKALGA